METASLTVQDEVVKTICQIYHRSENSLQEDVITLRNWMKSQPHLPEVLDDKIIQNFLFLNKCSVERTKQKIDMYYTLRNQIPDIYKYMNPKNACMQEAMKVACWVTLPKLTAEMYRVVCFKILDTTIAEKLDPVSNLGLAINLYEVRLKEDVMYGDVVIYDAGKMNIGYVTKLTPSIISKMFTIAEKVYSTPLKKLYIVNVPSFYGTILSLMKKIMKPKLFERVVLCENTSILQEHFPKDILPRDYGGEEKSLWELNELMKSKFDEYQSRFNKLDEMRVNESLRPEPLKNNEILGFHGNFKALDVD